MLRLVLALAALLALGDTAAASAPPAEAKGHAESSASPYIVVDPFALSVLRDGYNRGFLVVEIGLDTHSLEDREYVEHLMPRLRDLYFQVLNLYVSRDMKLHRPPDVEVIRARLQAATDQIAGPDKAKVLLRQLLARRV